MKTYAGWSILVLFAMSAFGAEEAPETPSVLSAVTVYLDRALVTRTADAKVPAGKSEVVLAGLPAELADASIRAGATGATVRGVRVERIFLERTEAEIVRKLEDDLLALRDEETALRDELAVLENESQFLKRLSSESSDRAARMRSEGDLKLPDVAGVEKTLELVSRGLAANAAKVRDTQKKVRALEPKIAAKNRELSEKRGVGRLEYKKVAIALETAAPADVKIRLSYLLPGAMWFPSYDVRANLEKTEVELIYYAVVQQATGEDWSGVDLTLCASRPAERGAKPELTPWLLGGTALPFQTDQSVQTENEVNVGQQQVLQIRRQLASRAKIMQKAHEQLLENEGQVARLFRSVTARSTSVTFPAPGRAFIRTDGKPNRVTLATERLKMNTEYEAVPALSLATYVVGRAVNTGRFPLLPGDAGVYLGGDLLGATQMDFVAPGEEARFHLGVDETVKVTRQLDSKLTSIRSWGKRQRVEAVYSIVVENFKTRPVKVVVEEALPSSQDEAIEVKIRNLEPRPAEGDGENNRGLVKWSLTVPPGGKQTINLSYNIEYPLDRAEALAAPSPSSSVNPSLNWIMENAKK